MKSRPAKHNKSMNRIVSLRPTKWDAWVDRYRYAICCALSAVASLLSFVNPLLAGVAVQRALFSLSLPPVIAGMGAVNGTRILLRGTVSRLLRGRQRSPLIWLQNRVGKWLWWLEPALHVWGLPGIVLKKFGRFFASRGLLARLPPGRLRPRKQRRLTLSVASSAVYFAADVCVTSLSGLIYYFSRSYPFSLLPVLLPAAAAAPWFAQKSRRLRRNRNARAARGASETPGHA